MKFYSDVKALTVAASLAATILSGNAQAGGHDDALMNWAHDAGAAIDDVMTYPNVLARRGAEAVITYRVTIDADGNIQSVDQTKLQGSRSLSSFARRAVKKADWPALTDDMDRDNLTFAVQLSYQVASSLQEYNKMMRQPRVTTRQIAQNNRGPATASITILSGAN